LRNGPIWRWLAFVVEMGVLVALGLWGVHTGQSTLADVALGLGAPLIAIGVWAVFGAPRSTRRLRRAGLLALRIVFFGGGALALIAAGHTLTGVAFGAISAANVALIYAWRQDETLLAG
jgi:hypothetical protein